MGKRTVYTKITPLPNNIPRQLALDMLHSHVEVIELNPLVTGVESVEAPRNAASDEFFSQWYEISQVITWGFGIKKKISFKGVFHDQPWGLQTHIYAPMGVDMRNKYRIGGNQPGEPRETRELGLEIPQDGLYLREDVEIECAVPLTASFVKKEHKAATATMIDRLTKKAELLDEGKLHAMFDHGRLKTSKPSNGPTFADRPIPSPLSAPSSPALTNESPSTASVTLAATDEKGFGRYHDIVSRQSSQMQRPQSVRQSYHQHTLSSNGSLATNTSGPGQNAYEVQGSLYYNNVTGNPHLHHQPYPVPSNSAGLGIQQFRAELPGDSLQPPSSQEANSNSQRSSHDLGDDPEKFMLASGANHPANRHSYNGTAHASAPTHLSEKTQPDDIQLSRLSLGANPHSADSQRPLGTTIAIHDGTRIIKCPVCHLFDGDAAAVSYHIEKTHFGS